MTPTLAVVGSINVDLVVSTARLPGPGETVVGGTFTQHHGGKGGNQAVAAARAGIGRVAMIAAVGDDAFGTGSLDALDGDGVEISHVARQADTATGIALITVDENGENQISVAPGANGSLSPDGVRAALEDLSPSVVLASLEVPPDAILAAAVWSRDRGATFVLNPAPVDPIVETLLPLTSILTPNEREAASIGSVPPRVAVVQTRGGAGAVIMAAGGRTDVPAPSVNAVDTTGAGDCFNGVLAASLSEGLDLADSVRRAVVAASLAVTVPGARAGMPTRAALEELMSAG